MCVYTSAMDKQIHTKTFVYNAYLVEILTLFSLFLFQEKVLQFYQVWDKIHSKDFSVTRQGHFLLPSAR